uniref:ETFB lysine methyltransferase n=1 Tax=Cuerna arida TaxID=1464854 RepID=A0A1B6FL43_9HEMI
MLYSIILISLAVTISFQQDPSLDTNAWLEKYDKYRKVIEENTEITNEDNLTPEIRLHLITPKSRLWNAKTQDSPFKDSPFFAFYWAGGQGLTRYILDHPEIVRGQRVLDLGSGCGATAIAAARCGAKSVTANDIDPLTCYGIAMNAKLNDVNINIRSDNLVHQNSSHKQWDTILLADMFYHPDDANEYLPWLKLGCRLGVNVIIGDPGEIFRSQIKPKELKQLKHYFMPDVMAEKQGHITTEIWDFCHCLKTSQ